MKLFFVTAREVDDADDSVQLRLSTVKSAMKIRQLGVLGFYKIWHHELSCFCKHPQRCDCYTAAQHEFREPGGADPTENDGESDVHSAVPQPEYVTLSEQIVGESVIVIYEYDVCLYPSRVSGYSKETDEVVVGCNAPTRLQSIQLVSSKGHSQLPRVQCPHSHSKTQKRGSSLSPRVVRLG